MLDLISRLFGDADQAAFEERGYVVLPGAVEPDLIDRFWARVDRQIADNPHLTFGYRGKLVKNRDLAGEAPPGARLRVTDIEVHEPLAADLFLHPRIARFLKRRYGQAPTAIQTLTYQYSSQQGAHSDYRLVSPRTVGAKYDRDTLTASWVACEDADDDNGALILYPGSHTLAKKELKADFEGRYDAYRDHLQTLCSEAGIAPERFHARKGDVLLWHGDFVHAGGPIRDPGRTRRSLVTHYCKLDSEIPSKHPDRSRRFVKSGSYFA